MFDFEKITKQDIDALINDFCKMYEEYSDSVNDNITKDVMRQLLMSPAEYRELGMDEIAEAIEKARK